MDLLDVLPQYTPVTRDNRFLNLISLGTSAAASMLSTFNSVRISTLETQIVNNNKRVDHLVDITNLHEQHFKVMDKKLDDISDKLATLIKINKVHFAKMTDFMEQKFGTAVTISERLIHTAYINRLSPGALHHEALLEIVKYVNEIAQKQRPSLIHPTAFGSFSGGDIIHLQAGRENFHAGAPHASRDPAQSHAVV